MRTTPAATPWLQNNPILQWIIDLSDPVVFRWFNTKEREEIAAWGPGLPDRDAAFEYAVGRFPTVRPFFGSGKGVWSMAFGVLSKM